MYSYIESVQLSNTAVVEDVNAKLEIWVQGHVQSYQP